jgi:outer membrane protein
MAMAVLCCAGSARGNELISLYQLAAARDTTLQAASYQFAATIEAKPQALANFLPQLTGNASVLRERATFDAAGAAGVQSIDCALNGATNSQRCYATTRGVGLNLSQTLWSFQSFAQLREANSQAASADATYRGAQQELLLRVARAYFAVLAATDQLDTNRKAREAFATLLDQAKVREQTGVGPHADVELAQAYFDATDQSVIDAQNSLDDAQLAVAQIVGSNETQFAPLRETIPLTLPEPASIQEWVVAAAQGNYELRAAELRFEAASRDIEVQRGKGLPSIVLTGSISKAWQDPVLGGDQSLDTVGVSLVWPLFQGGAVASLVRQSRALYHKAQAEVDSFKRDAERQTRAAYRDIVSGVQRINAARRAMDSGRDAVEASRRNVEFGTGSEIDLLTTQNNYYSAIRAYSQTRYDYLTSVLTLKQQAGQLTERDLLAVDNLLVETQS